jgi:hypothetical protein
MVRAKPTIVTPSLARRVNGRRTPKALTVRQRGVKVAGRPQIFAGGALDAHPHNNLESILAYPCGRLVPGRPICSQSCRTHRWYRLVDQTLPKHRAAEGPADERRHQRVSQCGASLSPNQMCEKLWTLPKNTHDARTESEAMEPPQPPGVI